MKLGDKVVVEFPSSGEVGPVGYIAEVVDLNEREALVRSSHTQNLVTVPLSYIKQG